MKAFRSATCKPASLSRSATTSRWRSTWTRTPFSSTCGPIASSFDLTVITRDRSRLFADVAGALAAWGMNIVRAGAFSNEAGVIVDSFHFSDVFRTIELNPSEKDRFLANIHDVVAQKVSVQQLLEARRHLNHPANLKVEVATRLEFDSDSSTHSTLLQVVAQDLPGLLRQIALTLSPCNATSRWR